MPTVNDVHKMGLHDTCIVSKEYISAIRVPGGWIYTISTGAHTKGQTFVPHSEEFNINGPSYQALKDQYKTRRFTENQADNQHTLSVGEILKLMRKYTPEVISPEDCSINITDIGGNNSRSIKLTWIFRFEHHEYIHNITVRDRALMNGNIGFVLDKAKYNMQGLIK